MTWGEERPSLQKSQVSCSASQERCLAQSASQADHLRDHSPWLKQKHTIPYIHIYSAYRITCVITPPGSHKSLLTYVLHAQRESASSVAHAEWADAARACLYEHRVVRALRLLAPRELLSSQIRAVRALYIWVCLVCSLSEISTTCPKRAVP